MRHRTVHDPQNDLRIKADEQHRQKNQAEYQYLARADVFQGGHPLVFDLAEHHLLDEIKRVGRGGDERHGHQHADPEIGVEAAENHHEFTHETGSQRQAGVRQHEGQEEVAVLRHRFDDTTELGDFVRVHAIVEHAHTEEESARDQAVGNHLHKATLDGQAPAGKTPGVLPDHEDHEESQRHEAHVRNGGIGNELLHVLLRPGHETDIDDRDDGERDHEPLELEAPGRGNRQAETQETVGAHLQENGGEDHRAAGGRLDVRIRQPCVDRHHRHLDRKRSEQAHENEYLWHEAQTEIVEIQDVERARPE